MYRLMIVEDEPVEREALKLMIQTNCQEISIIDEAGNGFEAIAKCRQHLPHIVLIDLNMPGIHGLETIRELQKMSSDFKILILSAYNTFEYAQEAIKLGVEDFLVKPAKVADIKKAISNIVDKMARSNTAKEQNTALLEKMEEIKPILESNCIHGIVTQKKQEELRKMFSFLEFNIESGFCFAITYEKSPRMILGSVKRAFEGMGLTCIGEQFHHFLIFFILENRKLEEKRRTEVGKFVNMFLKEEGWENCNIGIGRIYRSLEELYRSYQEVISVLETNRNVDGELFFYEHTSKQSENKKVNIEQMARQALDLINKDEDSATKECVAWIITELILKQDKLAKAKEYLNQLMTVLILKLQSLYPDIDLEGGLPYETIMSSGNGQELEAYCVLRINYFRDAVSQYKMPGHNFIIDRALEYIEKNYQNGISLNDVAEELGISIFYLSKIIKKNTGKNFTDILSEKRIAVAMEMLSENRSVKEITYAVGFNSQNYFTKVFKKYVGCTPREYRKNDSTYS